MNQPLHSVNDELLVKQLLGEATAAETEQVNHWLQQSEANRRYYDHFRLIWEQSRHIAAQSSLDTDAAWQRFQTRVGHAKPTRTIGLGRSRWMQLAALLVLMLGAVAIIYRMAGRSDDALLIVQSGNEVLRQNLPDGSVVMLNKASSLEYPRSFEAGNRRVKLNGEAFFEVKTDAARPFEITTDAAQVRVLGTSFNVRSAAGRTEVAVETGLVEVSRRQDAVRLRPQEKAIASASGLQSLKYTGSDMLYHYYRTRELVYEATPLYQVADILTEAYGVPVVVDNPQLQQEPLTATFRQEPLEQVVQVIAATFNLQVVRRDGQVILK